MNADLNWTLLQERYGPPVREYKPSDAERAAGRQRQLLQEEAHLAEQTRHAQEAS